MSQELTEYLFIFNPLSWLQWLDTWDSRNIFVWDEIIWKNDKSFTLRQKIYLCFLRYDHYGEIFMKTPTWKWRFIRYLTIKSVGRHPLFAQFHGLIECKWKFLLTFKSPLEPNVITSHVVGKRLIAIVTATTISLLSEISRWKQEQRTIKTMFEKRMDVLLCLRETFLEVWELNHNGKLVETFEFWKWWDESNMEWLELFVAFYSVLTTFLIFWQIAEINLSTPRC